MNEYTFRFYRDEKHLTTQTFHTETVEQAYKLADGVLRKSKYDDWEYLEPKKNVGSQKSPFGIGS